MWFPCHWVRAQPATVETNLPEVAYKGQCSSVFSPRVCFSRSALPVYSNISLTTRQTPASQKQPELIYSETELQRETVPAHSAKLFIFSVSVQRKKKKRDHFQWVKLLSWDLCLGRRSVKDKLRCFKLFTVCFLPSLPPLSIEAFFLLLLPFFFPP